MQRVHSVLYRNRGIGTDRLITFGTGFWCYFIVKERVLECSHLRLGGTLPLEYCSSVWSPQYQVHIDRIKSVQKISSLKVKFVYSY